MSRVDQVGRAVFAGAIFAFAVVIIATSFQLPNAIKEANGQIYPLVVGTVLALAVLAELLDSVRHPGAEVTDRVDDGPETSAPALQVDRTEGASSTGLKESTTPVFEAADDDPHPQRRIYWVLGLSILYPITMDLLGFNVASFLYAAAVSALLQPRTPKGTMWALITGAGITLFCYLVFDFGLNAQLPEGRLL